jgi:ubiquinone/menaquinone biosynthesis C-methylase UbiE
MTAARLPAARGSGSVKLNRLEKLAMNNPIRAAIQRWYEAPLLERLGGRVAGLEVLEIGCGQGVGTEQILNRFGARRVHAVDLDEGMVARARRRLSRIPPERVRVEIADVTALPFPDRAFDAVFDFAILHHVPDWQAGIAEVRRVLRPGGRFFFEEVTRHALSRWSYRLLTDHPTENRFTVWELAAELERLGFRFVGGPEQRYFGDFVYGVARLEEVDGG